ncbi:MAG TPA: DUF6492 family protein [Marinobacter sp.]|uniref:DUF6492 family protein n=1 Tax=Marinobacter sp. TaxID=50741 RepID=UPI002D801585|nr:DUF6492 family protein [Marinobacter sp.]HET8800820.1 DUF6492 family protein [Marinobacter sp.]
MTDTRQVILITPTWAGDIDHFRVMRRSLEVSPLCHLPHYVVVQTEDLPLFEEFRGRPNLVLQSTADVLPPEVERRRVHARHLGARLGRNLTRIAGSLARSLSWPSWPSYTGWHTQQLCKLKVVNETECDLAVVLDSDVFITGHASIGDFIDGRGVVCLGTWEQRSELKGKVKKWVAESERLVGAESDSDTVNTYFDTPFVFDRETMCQLLAHLERTSGKPWWQALLDRPPRRWSEFGVYKAFLARQRRDSVIWRTPEFSRYLYDTSNPDELMATVRSMINDPEVHYITIHSHSSGRETWDASAYLNKLLAMIETDGQ